MKSHKCCEQLSAERRRAAAEDPVEEGADAALQPVSCNLAAMLHAQTVVLPVVIEKKMACHVVYEEQTVHRRRKRAVRWV